MGTPALRENEDVRLEGKAQSAGPRGPASLMPSHLRGCEGTSEACATGNSGRSSARLLAALVFVGFAAGASGARLRLERGKPLPSRPQRCPHGRQRSQCGDCGGQGVCAHNRVRTMCVKCGGRGICHHGRQRYSCRECGGRNICIHGRHRRICKDCGGGSLCEHGRQKRQCRECGGAAICEHGKYRSTCLSCRGSAICEHGRIRRQCSDCGGAAFCAHARRKTTCRVCMKEQAAASQRDHAALQQLQPSGGAALSRRPRHAISLAKHDSSTVDTDGREGAAGSLPHSRSANPGIPAGLKPFGSKGAFRVAGEESGDAWNVDLWQNVRVCTEDDLRRDNEHLTLTGPCPFDCQCCVI